jgi:predicted  nucleic acid-binding Zn-ribbon protein
MTEHPEGEPERELEDMDERAERLEDEIDAAREDWERKKQDPAVPGAAGDPRKADEDIVPEADEPS